MDSTTIVSGTHLLDIEGGRKEKTSIDMSLITICMLTAIDLTRKQVDEVLFFIIFNFFSHVFQKRPIAPCTSKLISNNKNSLDKRLIDFYMRRWLDLSAYITCFHSIYFYTKRLTIDFSQTNNSLLYTNYSDQDLYVVLKSGLSSISVDCTYSLNIERELQFGTYGECYYCCLLRSDELNDKSDMSIQKRFEIIDGYAPSIFYLEVSKEKKNVNDNHLILDNEFFLKFNGLEIINITNVCIDKFELSFT